MSRVERRLVAQRESAAPSHEALAEALRALLGWLQDEFDECRVCYGIVDTIDHEESDCIVQKAKAALASSGSARVHVGHSKRNDEWCECGSRIEDCDYLQENLA
jgi:hypothetical protein